MGPPSCGTPPLLGANEHTTLYSTYVHGHASCAPARLRSQSPLLRLSGRALGSSRSLARLPGVTRLPLQSFLMPLPRLWPRLRFAFDWYRSLRERRRPGRGLPGRGRRHRVSSPPLPGRSGRLSLVGESRPHPRPLYRSRLALPLRRLLTRLGRGGAVSLAVDHGGPAAAATGLPPVGSHGPTPLAEAESARLSPPPTVDSRPHPGPSGTWSTWSAVGSLTSRAGELRSAPSGPDDRDRVTG